MACRVIAGIRFIREDDGHYYSEGGGYALFHQFREYGRRREEEMQGWALAEIDVHRVWVNEVDWDTHLVMLVHRGKRGAYKLVDKPHSQE